MSLETYSSTRHSIDALSDSIESLPDNFVLVGSIGRCALMGELKPLRRDNGTPTDLDVIDLSGRNTSIDIKSPGIFRVDAGMTNRFRPVEDSWGLFLPGETEPFSRIDGELCQPETVNVSWVKSGTARVEPLAIQASLVDLLAPYLKNKQHIQKFKELANSKSATLPTDIQRRFDDYKVLSWHINKYGTLDNPYSISERVYRMARRNFIMYTPPVFQTAITRIIGPAVRTARGTKVG